MESIILILLPHTQLHSSTVTEAETLQAEEMITQVKQQLSTLSDDTKILQMQENTFITSLFVDIRKAQVYLGGNNMESAAKHLNESHSQLYNPPGSDNLQHYSSLCRAMKKVLEQLEDEYKIRCDLEWSREHCRRISSSPSLSSDDVSELFSDLNLECCRRVDKEVDDVWSDAQ